MSTFPSYLVTPSQLVNALSSQSSSSAPRVITLCGSWFLPNDPKKRTGNATYLQKRIPGARFFDLDAVRDLQSPYPHMLPSQHTFATAMSLLGIAKQDTVVVYDTEELGIFSAPRVAWTLKVFGHEGVHVLNNFRVWCQEGRETEGGAVKHRWERTEYPVAELQKERVIDHEGVETVVRSQSRQKGMGGEPGMGMETQLLDLRSPGRFDGSAPEPRPGLSSGHMPGSINMPLSEILDEETGAYLRPEELRKKFELRGIDPARPIVSTCGTGVMAAAMDTALDVAGYGDRGKRRVYDGSWTEYVMRAQETGQEGELIVKREV